MANKGAFPIKVDSSLHGFAHALKSAACEWLLLFLLLLDAAFSFLLTKFAQYCELQLPCILCSRLDHILGKEKPDFYRNLLCNNHKSEISSLVSCHNHGKLVDVHGMCEECLLSFVKIESSEETYKLLVGKLGSDCFQKPLLSLDIGSGSLTTKYCSCCSKPWRSRPNIQTLIQSNPSSATPKPGNHLPKTPTHRSLNHHQEGVKKNKNRLSLTTTSHDLDSLSHVGYTEVKISSDSESDYPFSDDEVITLPQNRRRDEFLSQQGSKSIPRRQYDFFPAMQFQKSTPATSDLLFPNLKPEKGKSSTPDFVVSNGDIRPSIGELNWPQILKKAGSAPPELGSLDDIPLSSNAPQVSLTTSAIEDGRVSLSTKFDASGFSDFISHKTPLPPKSIQQPAKLTKKKHIETKDVNDLQHASAVNNWESIDLNSTSTDPIRNDVPFVSNYSSVIGERDLAPPINIRDVKPSTLFAEQLAKSSCNGIGSVGEQTASNTPDPRTDSSSINISSTMNGPSNEPHKTESPRSIESQMKTKSTSVERSPSFESLEESVSDIEGESLVDRLRRQVEYDNKRIKSLYQELDEERNAAAISANQAMAMITKLQEEKSALNMEALQYLRLMEEQEEYDVDALEKANDMIAEKEKVIQDLESDIDYLRMKYPEDFPEMNEEIMFAEDDDPQGSYIESLEVEKS